MTELYECRALRLVQLVYDPSSNIRATTMLITSAAVPLSAIQVAEVKSCEIIIVSSIVCSATLSTGLLSALLSNCCSLAGSPTIYLSTTLLLDPMAMRALYHHLSTTLCCADPWL
jgi:hypothetical protein